MKICEYHPRISYYVGGGELVVIEQIKRLSQNHEITIVTSETDEQTEQFMQLLEDKSVNVEYFKNPLQKVPLGSFEGTGLNKWDIESLLIGQATKKFFEQNKFDLIVTHYSVDNLLLPKKVNNILHLHGVPPTHKELDRLSLKNTNYLVSVAEFVAQGWKRLYHLNQDIPVCYNGIDIKKFTDMKNNRDIDVLYIGRLVSHKKVDLLIEALRNQKNIKICIGGEGIERKRLETKAKNYNIDIEFLGYVPDQEIVKKYNQTKIFVHLADTREGVITTALEAMACGAIPIVSASCGMLEAVENSKNGFTFNPGDKENLKTIIEKIHRNFGDYGDIREEAKKTVLERFDCNKNTLELERIYEKCVNQNEAKQTI